MASTSELPPPPFPSAQLTPPPLRQLPEPDYESLLAQLETSIKARESHLLSIRLRERRANALFVTYGLGAWILYVALWWFGVVGAAAGGLERALGGVPVIGGPVV